MRKMNIERPNPIRKPLSKSFIIFAFEKGRESQTFTPLSLTKGGGDLRELVLAVVVHLAILDLHARRVVELRQVAAGRMIHDAELLADFLAWNPAAMAELGYLLQAGILVDLGSGFLLRGRSLRLLGLCLGFGDLLRRGLRLRGFRGVLDNFSNRVHIKSPFWFRKRHQRRSNKCNLIHPMVVCNPPP